MRERRTISSLGMKIFRVARRLFDAYEKFMDFSTITDIIKKKKKGNSIPDNVYF